MNKNKIITVVGFIIKVLSLGLLSFSDNKNNKCNCGCKECNCNAESKTND